ncbi:MAG: bifunctional hydroxymethylpyrimidine kinase/phosphomethylpyrimidine kinase [Acidobacteria bacterium]|nr:bifunctional hydroxymethylpyrimidine kinase/phosphomethylpyrimidine kinase [Acidobacteriota bacterium]
MTLAPLAATRARQLVDRFEGLAVLVAGDAMLDRFIVGCVTRISPEAPVPVVRFESEHERLGGAANVAHNIAALGGHAILTAVAGADEGSARLKRRLAAAGVPDQGLVDDPGRRTTEKVRIVTDRNQQVARVDYETDLDIAGGVEAQLIERIECFAPRARAVLVSDYLKGAITRPIVEALLARRSVGVPLVVDPKVPHLACYRGASLVTPNQHEAEIATHRRIRTQDDARDAAQALRAHIGCGGVLITRGEHGLWLSDASGEGAVAARAREVSDVTGAGDTVAAALALALAAGATPAEAAVLANHAAGVVVGKFGPATLTRDELLSTF